MKRSLRWTLACAAALVLFSTQRAHAQLIEGPYAYPAASYYSDTYYNPYPAAYVGGAYYQPYGWVARAGYWNGGRYWGGGYWGGRRYWGAGYGAYGGRYAYGARGFRVGGYLGW